MCDPLITAEIAKGIPVIIGGILAVLGGVGSQVVVHHFTDKREQTKLRREKIEALVKAVCAHRQWIEEKQNRELFRGENHDVARPLHEADMLRSLYFPELTPEFLALLQAEVPLSNFIGEQKLKRMKDLKNFIDEYESAIFNEAYAKYISAESAVIKRARSLL
jgi:hypothetical protein